MSENHKEGIPVYTSGITNLVTITAAGLAASTALMQIAGANAGNRGWYLAGLIVFFLGLVSCFLTMSGLTGQAVSEKPNVDVENIRYPAIAAFSFACVGFILLGTGAFSSLDKKQGKDEAKIVLSLERCRSEVNATPELRLKCYDSYFDSRISEVQLTSEEIQSLPEGDRTWIKMFVLKAK